MLIRTKWRLCMSWRHFGWTLWRSQLLCSWRNFYFFIVTPRQPWFKLFNTFRYIKSYLMFKSLWWIGNESYAVGVHRRTSSSDERSCKNGGGGTQFNIHTCLCPGGLLGKYCKLLKFTRKIGYFNDIEIKFKMSVRLRHKNNFVTILYIF